MAPQMTLALETSPGVLTIWWIFLIAASIITALDVVLLVRLIQAALRIKYLAGRALPSAAKIAEHTASINKLEATNRVAADLISAAKSVVATAASMEQKVDNLAKGLAR